MKGRSSGKGYPKGLGRLVEFERKLMAASGQLVHPVVVKVLPQPRDTGKRIPHCPRRGIELGVLEISHYGRANAEEGCGRIDGGGTEYVLELEIGPGNFFLENGIFSEVGLEFDDKVPGLLQPIENGRFLRQHIYRE